MNMAGTLQTIKATVEPDGTVHLLQPVSLDVSVDAVLTFHIEDSPSHKLNEKTIAALNEPIDELERFDSVEALFAELEK